MASSGELSNPITNPKIIVYPTSNNFREDAELLQQGEVVLRDNELPRLQTEQEIVEGPDPQTNAGEPSNSTANESRTQLQYIQGQVRA